VALVVPEALLLLPLLPAWEHLPQGVAVLTLALLEVTVIRRLVEQGAAHNINNSNYSHVESQGEALDRFSDRLAGALQQYGPGTRIQS
jgi:hypothetical protein